MQSTNDRNSDVDDISINTNLKVFNGGLGLNKNQKKESNNNSINKNEKNKISNYNKEFQDIKEKNYKENNLNARSKEIKLDKDSLIETEGIISFRSKKISKTENDETPNINNITNGIINKIDKLNKNPNKKETRNFINNSINDSNLNEEHTINKIFKLNDEKETEKEIKNFEKESQRIQSKILAGNPLESSSSDFSEEYDKYEGFSTDKIKKTLDDINLKNLNKNGKTKSNLNINAIENKPINNYNKNYNTIGGDEKINFGNSPFDDNNQQNDSGDINEKNIFWNLRGNNEEIENSNFNHNNYYKRSQSAIDRDYNNQKTRHHRQKRQEKEIPISNFKGTLSKIEKGYAIFVTTDDVIMLLPSFLIPRNLGIGDSFTFKIYEGQKYNNKVNNIYDIQKKYTKSIGK